MKINLHSVCFTCSKPETGSLAAYYREFEIRDDNFYELECPKGHKTYIYIQNQKFEILFDFGALALIDGYTREAVASFAASLERFYEFYIEVIRIKYNISDEEYLNSWKLISNQSERQLGAFLFIYLLDNKKAIDFRDIISTVEFRNKVIHKGYIPTFDETLKYGEVVLSFISERLKELKATSERFVVEKIGQSRHDTKIFRESGGRTDYRLDTIINFYTRGGSLTLRCETVKNYNLSNELDRMEKQKRKKGYVYSFVDFLTDNPQFFQT